MTVPVSCNDLFFLTFHLLCKFQDRRNTDSTTHKENFFPLSLLYRKTISQRSQYRNGISGFHLRKFIGSGSLSGHSVNQMKTAIFFVNLTKTDRSGKNFGFIICIKRYKLSWFRICCDSVSLDPHTVNACTNALLTYNSADFSCLFAHFMPPSDCLKQY